MKAIMKSTHTNLLRIAFLAVCMTATAGATVMAQGGRIQTTNLDSLVGKATDTVDLTLDERAMQFAAKFLDAKDPDEASVKSLISGLKVIHVRILEFANAGQYSASDLEPIRSQVRSAPWQRVADLRSKQDGDMELYLLGSGNAVEGLTLMILEPKEITVVNIVGAIDLEKLSQLEGKFGIPQINIDSIKIKKKIVEKR
jgi:hypothetical protein